MCGIAGIVNGDPGLIGEKQIHRGPDHFGVSGLLSHNRLSIIDLSQRGNQPLTCGRYQLTYNGEIYSYKEMAAVLDPNDDKGTTRLPNDAVTLIRYIDKFGVDKALRDSIGMFAFGLYDDVSQTLTIAVDRFAEKPCYYYHSGDVFAFASSPHSLLHLKDKWKINEMALQSYWKLGSVMYDSIWDGIKKVNGAEKVTYEIRKNSITTERYWQPTYQSNTNGIEDLVLDAIQKTKVADTPVYIFLSGGIDSTLVASQFSGGHAIHLDSPEYGYAKQAAERFKITLHKVSPRKVDPLEAIKDNASKCGEPLMAGIIPYIVSEQAAKLCKVAISANGADELFFGYNRTSQEVTEKQLSHIFRDLPGVISVPVIDERLSKGRWLELMTYVQSDLNKTLDFSSMSHSLEVRSPFLDHRLVELALSIPMEKHFDKQLGGKAILKRMLKKMGFDNKFLTRKKQGFSLYIEPEQLNKQTEWAFKWAVSRGYLPSKFYSPRDYDYLKMSALAFYGWHETFKHKIA